MFNTMEINEKIIAVIGLSYVGLMLAIKQVSSFKLCLLSLQLLGCVQSYLFNQRNIVLEVVFTKHPNVWDKMVCPNE